VNDIIAVHVSNRLEHLSHEKDSLRFRQLFPTLDHLIHTLVVTEFEQNVAVVTVFEKVFVFANVFVFERAVNLNLSLQLRGENK
jgi:hypothetical protein